jgi:hypothetical protein
LVGDRIGFRFGRHCETWAVLFVQPQRRSAITVSNFGIFIGAAGLVLTASMIAVSPAALLLPCVFLAWPALAWCRVGRNGPTITVRSVFGSQQLEADRCLIGYRVKGGGRSAELTVYITDGVKTVNLAEHSPGSTGRAERDVARLTASLLDLGGGDTGARGTDELNGEAARPGARRPQGVVRSDLPETKARRTAAARRKVGRDRDQIDAGREYVRSYYGGRDWWASRRFWLRLVLIAGGALFYAAVIAVLVNR